MHVEKDAVSIGTAAERAGFGRSLMYKLLAEGRGPRTFTVGSRRLVRIDALRSWLAQLEAEQNGDARAE